MKKELSIRKGQNADFLETGKKQIQKPSRLISAGKAKPKGCEKRAIDPKGPKCGFLGVSKKQIQNPCRSISAGKAKLKAGKERAINPKGPQCIFFRGR